MKADKYQETIEKFVKYPKNKELEYCTIGLCSEAGEVADKVKKHIRDGRVIDTLSFYLELGDCLFYIARLCSYVGISLSEVIELNIEKLEGRLMRNKIQGDGDNR